MNAESTISYELKAGIAHIKMDDGKVNALSHRTFADLNRAFDQAEHDRAIVVLTGRSGVFSAGFELPVLRGGGEPARTLLISGFTLAERLLSFPMPIVVACSGHALAMGVFLVLAGDYRIGADGAFKIGANEVAIGMTVPYFAIEICRQRLTPAHFNRATILAEIFSPTDAVAAGFLDRVVPASELDLAADTLALQLAKLDLPSLTATKVRARAQTLKVIRAAIEADDENFFSRT